MSFRFGAFTNRLNARVRLVGAYLTCLRAEDAGGHGPKIEGHSFFTDLKGIRILREHEVCYGRYSTAGSTQ